MSRERELLEHIKFCWDEGSGMAEAVQDVREHLKSADAATVPAHQAEPEAVRLLREARDILDLDDFTHSWHKRAKAFLSRPPGPDYQQQAANWEESARFHCKNEEYYRGLVQQIGDMLGTEAYVSDDGSVQQDVLCAKVPELVKARLSGPNWRTLLSELLTAIDVAASDIEVDDSYKKGTERGVFLIDVCDQLKAARDALASEAAADGKGAT